MHIKKGDENLMSLYKFPDNFLVFLMLCAFHYIIAKAITFERLCLDARPFSSRLFITILAMLAFVIMYLEIIVLMASYASIARMG